MKKLSILFTAALAALTVFSCAKEENVKDIVPEGPTISFTAIAEGTDVKTVVDASENWANWSASDQLKIIEYADGTKNLEGSAAIATLSSDNKTATFTATITGDFPTGAAASYVAAYPATRLSEGGSSPNTFYRLMMPASQSPVVGSFDPNADLLISAPVSKSDNSRVSDSDELSFRFHRLGTAVKMTLSGLTDGEKLKEVSITAPVNIAGYVRPDMTNGGYVSGVNIPYSSESKTITLTIADWVISGDVDVWFRVLPGEWNSLEIEARTDVAHYYRTTAKGSNIDLSASPLQFVDGGRTRFTVGMGAVREEEKHLADGNYLILAKNGDSYYAMKAEGTGNDQMVSVDYSGSLTSYSGDADLVWSVTKSGGSYIIANDGKNLGFKGSSNKAFWLAPDTDWTTSNYLLDIVSNGDVWNVKHGDRYLSRNTGLEFFAFYSNVAQYEELLFVPATVTSKTPVLLSFSESAVNLTTATYTSFAGQPVIVDPNVTAITEHLNWSYTDPDGIIEQQDEDALILNGTTGTATVTVSFAGDANYRDATASYTINVSTVITGPAYRKVTAAPVDWSGEYLMVCENVNKALSEISTTSTKYGIGADVTISSNAIASTPTVDAYKVTIAKASEGDAYTLSFAGSYLNWGSGNSLSTASSESDNSRWTISASTTAGNWLITNVAQNTRVIWYNTGSPRFACYENKTETSSGYAPVQLYVLEDSRTEAGMSWSASAATATYSTGNSLSFSAPTLTQGNASSVTYSSSDETIATIDATSGAVTINLSGNDVKEGSTVISASFDGDTNYKSQTVSYTLTVIDNRTAIATPTFDPAAGEVAANTVVTFNCADSGVTFYYTLDGSAPTTASTSGNSVTIDAAKTVKVIAAKAGYRNSNVASADYSIVGAYETLPFEESFASNKGTFTIDDISNPDNLAAIWNADASNHYMKGTSYSGSNHNAESWLVSPLIQLPSLASGESVKLKFEQCINKYFGTISDEATLWVKTEGGSWTQIVITYPALSGGNWSSFEQQIVDLSGYAGNKIQFAFKYVGTSTTAGTWEVRNVSVKKYEPKALTSISVKDQKTNFHVGDTFSFGGKVTALYNDETTADVTASATFTGYDMSTAGEQTVTVSYTEGVTKTATYTINVTAGSGPSTYVSTFNSASWGSGGDFSWTSGKAGAGFNNNGVQVTSSATGANATTNKTFTGVTQVVVTYNTNKSAGAGTLVLKVGSNADHTENWAWSSGDGRTANYTCTFTIDPAESGVIKLTANTTTNSIYIVSVAVTATSMD